MLGEDPFDEEDYTMKPYRGYDFTLTSEGGVHVWYGEDLVETVDTEQKARDDIDAWHDAG